MRMPVILVVVIALLPCTAWAECEYDQAMKHYLDKRFTIAHQGFLVCADEGHAKAQTMLGTMFFMGRGLAKNYLEAYKWLTLATDQGYEGAIEGLVQVRERMTDEQITQAKELVENWYKEREVHQ